MVAAGMVDRGGIDFSLETAACKVFASELAFRAANDALQIAGGIGYSKEFRYEQAVRDSRINLIFEGTNEILRALIALMGTAAAGRATQGARQGVQGSDPLARRDRRRIIAGRAKRTITKPAFSRSSPERSSAKRDRVATLVHDLALGVESGGDEVRQGDLEKQFLQERMANAAIDIFLATAVLSRTTWEIERAERLGGEAVEGHIDCARVFVPMAYRRARRSIRGLRRNQDARLKSLAERSLETGELGPEAPADER